MRVLCLSMPSDDLGLPSRLLPVAAELRERGDEVAFANPAPAPSRLISGAGFANLEVEPMTVRPVFPPGQTPYVRDLDHLLALTGYMDRDYTHASVDRWVRVISRWRPDVVLDSMGVSCCAAARILGVPLVEILQGDFHPDGPGFTWWMTTTAAPSPVEAFNAVLEHGGVSPVDRAARLLLGGATLVTGSDSTDPVPDPDLIHVGALAWGERNAVLPAAVPAPGGRPLVYVYGGKARYAPGVKTWADSAVVVDATLQALAGMDLDVVLGAGYQQLPASLPSNVVALEYVPGQALANRADVLVHHGGHGSTLTGLAAGRPSLILPSYSERESNARRVAQRGAGLWLAPERIDGDQRLDPQLVADATRKLLEERSYLDAALAASRELAALPGAGAVADVVGGVL